MHWKEHIPDSKDALIKSLISRASAIKKISTMASFRTRKMVANGIFMSKLIYLMPVWKGCEDYLVSALQVCQNKVARSITKLDKYTPTKVLLLQCGWLNVRQLMSYHSLVLMHKTIKEKKPAYLYKKVTSGSGQAETRQAAVVTATLAAAGVHGPPSIDSSELEVTRKSWCWSSVYEYNQLPLDIRMEANLQSFKTRLKQWVLEHVE